MEGTTSGQIGKGNSGLDRCSADPRWPVKFTARLLLLSLAGLCAACAQCPETPVHAVQGDDNASPLAGSCVTLAGVSVTAVGERGYFVQQPDGSTDDDPRTSEGLYVFGPSADDLLPGDRVRVSGRVLEFHGHTQIEADESPRRLARGDVPAAVSLDGAGSLEALESMRVSVRGGVVASPSDEHGEVRIAADGRRPMRLPDSRGLRELPEMDPAGLGGPARPLPAGQRFDAEGVLAYRYGDFVLWPTDLRTAAAPALPRPVRDGRRGELVVASYNLRLLYDARRAGDEPVVAPEVYRERLGRHARWLDEILRCPGVVALQEVETPDVLRELAAATTCGYRAYSVAGGDHLALGYLVGPGVRTAGAPRVLGADLRLPGGGPLFDRPPLVLPVRHGDTDLALVNVHLRSMRGLGEDPAVAAKRRAQADALNRLLRQRVAGGDGHLLVVGDFNALPFDDGHADVLGRISAGNGRPLSALWQRLPRHERYSYIYRGHAQMLDHALATPALARRVSGLAFARGNADAPAGDGGESLLRASDHDPLVVYVRTAD